MMNKFEKFSGIVAGINRPNIDTDAIIPKQYLKSIKRSGFGPNLFDSWRYLDPGDPGIDNLTRRLNPDFVLNKKPYDQAQIIVARENFACGSSREHAVWALMDFGFKVAIAPSFADIFHSNSFKTGFLPIALSAVQVDQLFVELEQQPGYQLTIDLAAQKVITPSGVEMSFEINEFRKHCLLEGLDDIGLTMQHAEQIKSFEAQYYAKAPWLV
ncbi:MAG: 3-isopropylmalate/(R)-2-methylmalate dehydratase small subunit [Gammaproteobacteria bacterium]|jgi:3-isopropylmalate/(R)-2-methylmalate dehydratase small subunit